jgi:hypothetical protein
VLCQHVGKKSFIIIHNILFYFRNLLKFGGKSKFMKTPTFWYIKLCSLLKKTSALEELLSTLYNIL